MTKPTIADLSTEIEFLHTALHDAKLRLNARLLADHEVRYGDVVDDLFGERWLIVGVEVNVEDPRKPKFRYRAVQQGLNGKWNTRYRIIRYSAERGWRIIEKGVLAE